MGLIRNQFIKVTLLFENDVKLPITIACQGMEMVPEMIERHRTVYQHTQGMTARAGRPIRITGFTVQESRPSINMTQEAYELEQSYCDIVQE